MQFKGIYNATYVAQGNGGTNWSEVGNGAMTFAGGAMAAVGGVAAGLTGVGTPLGVSRTVWSFRSCNII